MIKSLMEKTTQKVHLKDDGKVSQEVRGQVQKCSYPGKIFLYAHEPGCIKLGETGPLL